MKQPRIIVLNGVGSVGKTSTAKALQVMKGEVAAVPISLLKGEQRAAGRQFRLLQICKNRAYDRSLHAINSMRGRAVCATMVFFLLLPSCSVGDPITDHDWRNETVYVQVGEAVFELSPGRVYSLGGMKDEEINAALANGEGAQGSPLRLPSVRMGVPLIDTRGLDYDISIAEPDDEGGTRNAVAILDLTVGLSSVDFTQSPDNLSGKTFEGSATFRFSNGQVIDSPVGCSAVLINGEIRNVFCNATGLEHRGNVIALRARGGNADEVAEDFRRGLELISEITTK